MHGTVKRGRLASFLIHDIGAFHDLADFERLLAERAEDIFSIIQHNLVHAAEARMPLADAIPFVLSCIGITKADQLHHFLRV